MQLAGHASGRDPQVLPNANAVELNANGDPRLNGHDGSDEAAAAARNVPW